MSRASLTALPLLLGLAASTAVTAATAAPPSEISRARFVALLKTSFSAIDANHDGFLDSSEISAAQQKRAERALLLAQQRLGAEFDRLDTNHDGQLSKAELMALAHSAAARQTPEQILAALDANKDRKVSLDEYTAALIRKLDRTHAKHDGTANIENLQSAHAAKNLR